MLDSEDEDPVPDGIDPLVFMILGMSIDEYLVERCIQANQVRSNVLQASACQSVRVRVYACVCARACVCACAHTAHASECTCLCTHPPLHACIQ